MLSPKLEKALNKQLNFELYSSYLYFAMKAYLDKKNLNGFGHWMHIQSQEELAHVTKFYNYLNERSNKVTLNQIDAPISNYKSVLNLFEIGYNHECIVTKSVNKLVALAQQEKDYATQNFLTWFVQEQVEEEASFLKLVETLKLIKSDGAALFMLDKELAQRSSHV